MCISSSCSSPYLLSIQLSPPRVHSNEKGLLSLVTHASAGHPPLPARQEVINCPTMWYSDIFSTLEGLGNLVVGKFVHSFIMIISSLLGFQYRFFSIIFFMIRLMDVSVTQGIIHHTDTRHMMLCSPAGARVKNKKNNSITKPRYLSYHRLQACRKRNLRPLVLGSFKCNLFIYYCRGGVSCQILI